LGCARIRGEPGGKRPLRYSLRRQKREKGFFVAQESCS
jgi:hypothetical protein